jgi:hypothetical protein
MQHREFPGAEILARQVVDGKSVGDSGACVINDTLLAGLKDGDAGRRMV